MAISESIVFPFEVLGTKTNGGRPSQSRQFRQMAGMTGANCVEFAGEVVQNSRLPLDDKGVIGGLCRLDAIRWRTT
jgi:hypothetical protein